jgi:hypothetical protein
MKKFTTTKANTEVDESKTATILLRNSTNNALKELNYDYSE